MVNSRLCKTARPRFQTSRPRLEMKSRIRDSKSPEPRLRYPSQTPSRIRERAFRDPHFWRNHSIPLKGFIVLDWLRQIAHNIYPLLIISNTIQHKKNTLKLSWVQQNEQPYFLSIDKEANHFLRETQSGHYSDCRVIDLRCGSHVLPLIKWTCGDLYVSRLFFILDPKYFLLL